MIALLLAAVAFADDPPPPADPPAEPLPEETPPAEPPPENRDDDIFGTPTPPPDENRDDDIFGGSSTPTPTDTPPTTTDMGDDRIGALTTQSDIDAKLAVDEDRLAIGGQVWLQLQANIYEPTDDGDDDNDGVLPSPLTSPSFMDLYVDARPNDRVRAYARGRLKSDFTVQSGDVDSFGNEKVATQALVDQLWIRYDANHKVFFTIGQQRLKWGAGRFWNPTDFMNQQILDPLAVFDVRTGVGLVKVHVPIESRNINLYAIGNFDGAHRVEDVGGAFRAEWAIGSSELTASVAARNDSPVRIGGDVSTAVGPFDVHVEGAVRHGDETPFWNYVDDVTLPEEVDRSDDWIPQVTGGAELGIRYNDEDSMYIGAEYFYNGSGYDNSDIYPWLFLNGQYQPFYLGEHYIGAYASLPGPGEFDDASFTGSFIGDLSDRSYVARVDYSVLALTYLRINAFAGYHFGEVGEFHYSAEIPPIPGVLDDGLIIPAPIADVGLGARVDF